MWSFHQYIILKSIWHIWLSSKKEKEKQACVTSMAKEMERGQMMSKVDESLCHSWTMTTTQCYQRWKEKLKNNKTLVCRSVSDRDFNVAAPIIWNSLSPLTAIIPITVTDRFHTDNMITITVSCNADIIRAASSHCIVEQPLHCRSL